MTLGDSTLFASLAAMHLLAKRRRRTPEELAAEAVERDQRFADAEQAKVLRDQEEMDRSPRAYRRRRMRELRKGKP